MSTSGESLLVLLIVGILAGWLAGLVMRGSGYGIVGDMIVGLLGALIGGYLFQALRINLNLGHPVADRAAVAFVGAVVLLLVVGFFRPRSLGERMTDWFRRR